MNITQSFYDHMASQYDKLFLDWQAATQEQAVILDRLLPADCRCRKIKEHRRTDFRAAQILPSDPDSRPLILNQISPAGCPVCAAQIQRCGTEEIVPFRDICQNNAFQKRDFPT